MRPLDLKSRQRCAPDRDDKPMVLLTKLINPAVLHRSLALLLFVVTPQLQKLKMSGSEGRDAGQGLGISRA